VRLAGFELFRVRHIRFLASTSENGNGTQFIGVEPTSCPTLTKGEYKYDLGDVAGFAPMIKMYTLGHDFVPSPIHAGGLRYHGDAQSLSLLKNLGYVDAVSYEQLATFEAGALFTQTEGNFVRLQNRVTLLRQQ